ncbi:MAG: hypothetical protein M1321_02960 [Candidatus Marsarchaeota archaeon]|nr:hypothetical protein [Candidatus Marsarchaeota archaeon]
MTVDPEELLIFKNRQKQGEGEGGAVKIKEAVVPEQAKKKQEKPAREGGGQAAAQPPGTALTVAVQRSEMQQEAPPAQQRAPAPARKPSQSVDLNGVACTNHPWRQAFARCAICGMPYCYADLMPFHDKLYCLEDIDQATRMHLKTVEVPNRFVYLTSILFAAMSILLIYLMYIPAGYLIAGIMGTGLSLSLITVILQYFFVAAGLLLALLSLISAVLVIRHTPATFWLSAIVLVLVLITASYEYFTSDAQKMYLIIGLALVNMAALAAAKMDVSGSMAAKESASSEGIEWPRPELF